MTKVLADENTIKWIRTKLKNRLANEFIDIPKISDSTIGRFLKDELRWSYKKLEKKAAPTLTQVSWRKLLEGGMIQHKLISKNIETIYMDEFTVNTRGLSFRGWARKGDKGYFIVDSKDFCMTFIWGLSAKRVYEIMGSDGTITSAEVKHYIQELSESRKILWNDDDQNFVLMFNNARVHTSILTNKFISSSKLRAIRIPAYWPVLNQT